MAPPKCKLSEDFFNISKFKDHQKMYQTVPLEEFMVISPSKNQESIDPCLLGEEFLDLDSVRVQWTVNEPLPPVSEKVLVKKQSPGLSWSMKDLSLEEASNLPSVRVKFNKALLISEKNFDQSLPAIPMDKTEIPKAANSNSLVSDKKNEPIQRWRILKQRLGHLFG